MNRRSVGSFMVQLRICEPQDRSFPFHSWVGLKLSLNRVILQTRRNNCHRHARICFQRATVTLFNWRNRAPSKLSKVSQTHSTRSSVTKNHEQISSITNWETKASLSGFPRSMEIPSDQLMLVKSTIVSMIAHATKCWGYICVSMCVFCARANCLICISRLRV